MAVFMLGLYLIIPLILQANGTEHWCGIQSVPRPGHLTCLGVNLPSTLGFIDDNNTYSTVGTGISTVCAVQTGERNVTCWGSYLNISLNLGNITVTDLQVGNKEACALLSNKTMSCWNNIGITFSNPTLLFDQIHVSGSDSCGIVNHSKYCWQEENLLDLTISDGDYQKVWVGQDSSTLDQLRNGIAKVKCQGSYGLTRSGANSQVNGIEFIGSNINATTIVKEVIQTFLSVLFVLIIFGNQKTRTRDSNIIILSAFLVLVVRCDDYPCETPQAYVFKNISIKEFAYQGGKGLVFRLAPLSHFPFPLLLRVSFSTFSSSKQILEIDCLKKIKNHIKNTPITFTENLINKIFQSNFPQDLFSKDIIPYTTRLGEIMRANTHSTLGNRIFSINHPLYSVEFCLDNNIFTLPLDCSYNNNQNKVNFPIIIHAEIHQEYKGSLFDLERHSIRLTELDYLILLYGFFSDQTFFYKNARIWINDCHPGNILFNMSNNNRLDFLWTDFGDTCESETQLDNALSRFFKFLEEYSITSTSRIQSLIKNLQKTHEKTKNLGPNRFSEFVNSLEEEIIKNFQNLQRKFFLRIGESGRFGFNFLYDRIEEYREQQNKTNQEVEEYREQQNKTNQEQTRRMEELSQEVQILKEIIQNLRKEVEEMKEDRKKEDGKKEDGKKEDGKKEDGKKEGEGKTSEQEVGHSDL